MKRLSSLIKKRRNKYGAKRANCPAGHTHDSKFEAMYCSRLLDMKNKGEINDYRIQETFELVVHNQLICKHIVDFVVVCSNGEAEVHETKGVETDAWKIKRNLFKALYPTIKYITIKRGGDK